MLSAKAMTRKREYDQQWRDANKERRSKQAHARYLKNREKMLEQHRAYYAANKEQVLARNRRNRRLNPLVMRKAVRRWQIKNPEKAAAHSALYRAIKSGKLIRPDRCEACGNVGKPESHHYQGYGKANWLNVIWLCMLCHKAVHRK